jgi:hypothetical protein
MLVALGTLGIWIGSSLYSPIVSDPDRFLSVYVRHHSIRYDFTSIPVLQVVPEPLMRALYAVTIVTPLLLGDRGLKVFGAVVFVSLVVSQIFFAYAFALVWCLFAAVLSAYLVGYARGLPSSGRWMARVAH